MLWLWVFTIWTSLIKWIIETSVLIVNVSDPFQKTTDQNLWFGWNSNWIKRKLTDVNNPNNYIVAKACKIGIVFEHFSDVGVQQLPIKEIKSGKDGSMFETIAIVISRKNYVKLQVVIRHWILY